MTMPATAARRRAIELPRVPIWLVYAAGFVPAAWYLALAFTDRLGADPAKVLERALGLWALRFLVVGLALTPLRQLAGVNLARYRRALGLLAFWYVSLHLIAYVVLDQALDGAAIWADIVKRPYITVGMIGFALLVPLAATSSNAAIRRLGGQAWQRLHKLAYAAVAAAAVHFVLLVKGWQAEPLVYAAIVAVLLGYRAWRKLSPPQRVARG